MHLVVLRSDVPCSNPCNQSLRVNLGVTSCHKMFPTVSNLQTLCLCNTVHKRHSMRLALQKPRQSIRKTIQPSRNNLVRVRLQPTFVQSKANEAEEDISKMLVRSVYTPNSPPKDLNTVRHSLQSWVFEFLRKRDPMCSRDFGPIFRQDHVKPGVFRLENRPKNLVASVLGHRIEGVQQRLASKGLLDLVDDNLRPLTVVDDCVALAAVYEGLDVTARLPGHANDRMHSTLVGKLHGKAANRRPRHRQPRDPSPADPHRSSMGQGASGRGTNRAQLSCLSAAPWLPFKGNAVWKTERCVGPCDGVLCKRSVWCENFMEGSDAVAVSELQNTRTDSFDVAGNVVS
jgi:hypothetical protein